MSASPIALREHFHYQAWALPAEGETAEDHLIAAGVLSLIDALDAAEAKLAAIDRFTAESLMTEPGGNFEAGYDEACLDIRAILHPEETA